MPELPEVEVLRRSLEPRLTGARIARVEVRSPALREPLDRRSLRRLEGCAVTRLRRRAKYLLVDFERDRTLVIHLGMSGRFTLTPAATPVALHEHLAFYLDGGERLRLVDPRRFGVAFVRATARLESDPHFVHLGVEPLGEELTADFLSAEASGRRTPVKSFLMDARIVVGVGNIYACEALWLSGVHPRRAAGRIGRRRLAELTEAVRTVLGRAIDQGGTTLNDFTDGEGNAGYFQVSLSAYGREGEPCRRCRRPIRRIVQSGRSTFYCPGCQR
jgi:formamidopyrimidine-DNA glycosylase